MKVEPITQPSGNPDFNLTGGPQAIKGAVNISDVLKNKCVTCHGSQKQTGGLNFETPISDAQQASVLERITTKDATRRMPPKGELTVTELNAFFQAMGVPAK